MFHQNFDNFSNLMTLLQISLIHFFLLQLGHNRRALMPQLLGHLFAVACRAVTVACFQLLDSMAGRNLKNRIFHDKLVHFDNG